MMPFNASKSRLKATLFGLFALSGFSGLIYESIWTHYLKLFLGHAAYAQALVLALFMGGMAMGAALSGRWLQRLRNPLQAYVAVELAIGVLGLVFHHVFDASSAWMLDSVLPGLGHPLAIELLRWLYAALLILPQTLLLGATFPLMSSGLLRAFPELPGSSIALLYFSNSIGAVVGVLCSGFILIGSVGLPGTVMTAALVNFLLAAAVHVCLRRLDAGVGALPSARGRSPLETTLLLVALVTGLSSFVYEISWIRMLVLVLGASTHAFELMLSAFILGLALGGLWVRRHIDSFSRPLQALAVVQLLMGVFALATAVFYNDLFDIMHFVMSVLQRNAEGYVVFNVSSHVVAMLTMLPTTFMAGMTLPLMTYILFRDGSGESAIGRVYASNTLGAIIGVVLSLFLLLPLLGLKGAIAVGAALDLLLGVWLLWRAGSRPLQLTAIAALSALFVLGTVFFVHFDIMKMASGVYRHGRFMQAESVFHRDGRTATVDVVMQQGKRLSIITNGKVDAMVRVDPAQPPSADEPTMILTGGIPLLYQPEAKNVAVIGMGSGLSANMILASPTVERMDLIEIEAAMVEGARHFGGRVQRVYNDPRSHIHIDDAKSYFAAHHSKYDVIVSEPSNPWVSGVANLFSEEFYRRIRTHLNDDGLLVQWFQLYETNPDIVSSIIKAISPNFSDYVIYAATDSDVVLVARKNGKLPALNSALLANADFRHEFERVQWRSLGDIELHRLVGKDMMDPLVALSGAPANSDYFPYVDQHAVAARFRQEHADTLLKFNDSLVPLPGANFVAPAQLSEDVSPVDFQTGEKAINGRKMARYFAGLSQTGLPQAEPSLPDDLLQTLRLVSAKWDCRRSADQQQWRRHVTALMAVVLPSTNAAEARSLLDYLDRTTCRDAAGHNAGWLALFRAVSERDMPKQAALAGKLLHEDPDAEAGMGYVMEALMAGLYQQGHYDEVLELGNSLQQRTPALTFLMANAKVRLLASAVTAPSP
jgi:predicted membrane-bound spermidine synthase